VEPDETPSSSDEDDEDTSSSSEREDCPIGLMFDAEQLSNTFVSDLFSTADFKTCQALPGIWCHRTVSPGLEPVRLSVTPGPYLRLQPTSTMQ
jgi:hypothetical protein